jgi:hypothetical protein
MTLDENTYKGRSRVAASLFAVAILAAAPMPATAQQFSADLVARKDDKATAMGTLRVSGGKARIETVALPGNVATLDLTHYFCRARECNPVIGNVLVYRDSHHLTRAYAQTLAEPLQRALLAVSPQLIDSDALKRLADATS